MGKISFFVGVLLCFLCLFVIGGCHPVFASCSDTLGVAHDLSGGFGWDYNTSDHTIGACNGVTFTTALAVSPAVYENWPYGYRCGVNDNQGGYFHVVGSWHPSSTMPDGSSTCNYGYPKCGAAGIDNEKAIVDVIGVYSFIINSPTIPDLGAWYCKEQWTYFDGSGHDGQNPNTSCSTAGVCCPTNCHNEFYSTTCGCSSNVDNSSCAWCPCMTCPSGAVLNFSTCACQCMSFTTANCSAPKILDSTACTCTCPFNSGNCLAPYVLDADNCTCKMSVIKYSFTSQVQTFSTESNVRFGGRIGYEKAE